MSREIKFRGLCTRRKNWVYGYLSNKDVINTVNGRLKVIPETVGQYIGKQDRRGIDIYQGDKVKITCNSEIKKLVEAIGEWIAVVVYDEKRCCFMMKMDRENNWSSNWVFDELDFNGSPFYIEVIGNIHEKQNG